jgi:PmbA protein
MDLLEKIVEQCQVAGAGMSDVFSISRRILNLSVRDGQVEIIKRASPGGLGIRFFKDGKMAFGHSTDSSEKSVNILIPKLATMAEKTEKDPYAGMPEPQDFPGDLDILDSPQLDRPLEEKIEYLTRLEQLALKFDPIITKSNGVFYDEIVSTRSLANSRGVNFSFVSTSYRVGISVVAAKGEEMFPGEGSMYASHFSDLPSPEEIVRYHASRAVRLIGGTPVEAGDYEIIFAPDAGWSLLWGLNFALNGSNIFKGASFLSDKKGMAIAVEGFNVFDDALKPRGVSSRPVDDEGTPCRKNILVENGVVKNFLYDYKTALKAKTESTGSAYREDYSASPEINPSNFYIAPGKDKVEDVIASCKKGIIVEQTQGWGLHSVTGQYSAGINGILVENGKRIRPVAGATAAGTADDVLLGIGAICDDIKFYWNWTAPSIMVKRMRVSA